MSLIHFFSFTKINWMHPCWIKLLSLIPKLLNVSVYIYIHICLCCFLGIQGNIKYESHTWIHICLVSLQKASSSKRLSAWDMSGTQPGEQVVPNGSEQRKRRIQKGKWTQQDTDAKNTHHRWAAAHSSENRMYLTGTAQNVAIYIKRVQIS